MIYSSDYLRHILCPGDVILSRPESWRGWIVCLATWSKWAHVDIYARDGFLITSTPQRGATYRPIDEFDGRDVSIVFMTDPWDSVAATDWFAEYMLGAPYDWRSALAFGLPVFRWLPKRKRVFAHCAKLVTQVLQAGGDVPFGRLLTPDEADQVYPGQFATRCQICHRILCPAPG